MNAACATSPREERREGEQSIYIGSNKRFASPGLVATFTLYG